MKIKIEQQKCFISYETHVQNTFTQNTIHKVKL